MKRLTEIELAESLEVIRTVISFDFAQRISHHVCALEIEIEYLRFASKVQIES